MIMNDKNKNEKTKELRPLNRESHAIQLSQEFNEDILDPKSNSKYSSTEMRQLSSSSQIGLTIMFIIAILLSILVIPLIITIPFFVSRSRYLKGKSNLVALSILGIIFCLPSIVGILGIILFFAGNPSN